MSSILIVDDSAFSRKMIGRYVQKFFPDASIEYASDGELGLHKYTQLKPDCVFVDLLMPKMGGLDLIRQLKAEGCGKIVVVSADVQQSVRQEAESLGINAFLNKPLNDEKMRQLTDTLEAT